MFRAPTMRTLLVLGGLSLFRLALSAADAPPDLPTQESGQKRIQAETDRLVRRTQTMVRLLEYNRLDKTAEKQLLDQVADTLAGLSREQMVRLIDALEKAGKTEGDARASGLKEAQERHEQIVLGLKSLLARFDAVKSLEQAAERLDKMARDELDQSLQSKQLKWEEEHGASQQKSEEARLRAVQLAGEQGFLHRDLSDLLAQSAALRPLLPPEQQERLRQMEARAKASSVLDNLVAANRHLRFLGIEADRHKHWNTASQTQWQASGDIEELAQLLRGPREKLEALRAARQKIERALEDQETLQESTKTPPEKEKPDAKPEEMPELNRQWARGLSSRQASLEFDARATRALLEPHARELANKLEPVEKAMREAQTALRDQATRKPPLDAALKPQEKANAQLRDVKTELDRLIAEADKAQADPLANLKDALAKVEQIIKEQKDVRDKADEAGKTRNEQRLPHLAPKQEDLARRTEEVNQQPSAAKPEAKKALDSAAKAMEQAQKPLQDKQAPKATAKQDQALAKLQEAKKALSEQVAEVEKRRDDIAKLEETDRKLEEMIKKEGQVADETKKSENDKADALSKKQNELTPQAKELGKQLDKSVPEAAKHVAEGAKQMDAAKTNLDQKQLPPAAKNADKAVEDLKRAQKAVAKALDDKKGQEAADQAAMQPQIDSTNAAEQLAKALEETEKAAQQSEQASKQQSPQESAKSLTRSQAATKAAAAALAQAQAQAPSVVQPKLRKAGQKLAQAGQQLQKGEAQPANQSQNQAASQLQQALETLSSAMAQAGEKGEGESQKPGQGQGQGQKPGEGKGEGKGQGKGQGQGQAKEPGQGQGKSQQPGRGQERNESRGSGNRVADGQTNKASSRPGDMRGEGMFIHLPPRQRELIKQALNEKLPPEYAAMIQEYYVNIARGKAASSAPAKAKP